MFLLEKYRPHKDREFVFNREILAQLQHIATYEDIPHIIISGPAGSGKKTLVNFFLEKLFDSDVRILNKIKYNVNGSSTRKEVEIMQSNYHIIIEPTNTNHDKYILQEIIKQYARHKSFNIFRTNRKFKIIVIYNIENLASNSQAALRRTMELYARTCRFIMICNNLSKIFDPLRSRCRIFCVKVPSLDDIAKIIQYIALVENIDITQAKLTKLINNCNNSLKTAIWMLDAIRLRSDTAISLNESYDELIDHIMTIGTINSRGDIKQLFDDKIRTTIYNILITNIKGSDVIVTILDRIMRRINNDDVNAKIIKHAAVAEYNLVHGRRDITHIDYFIAGILRELLIYHATTD